MAGPTDPAEAHFDKGLWGFDGTVWRKLPYLWGYSDRYAASVENTNAAAGSNALYLTAVPENELWKIEIVKALNYNKLVETTLLMKSAAGDYVEFYRETPTVLTKAMFWTGSITAKYGDQVCASFIGCDAGNDLFLTAWGTKMYLAL